MKSWKAVIGIVSLLFVIIGSWVGGRVSEGQSGPPERRRAQHRERAHHQPAALVTLDDAEAATIAVVTATARRRAMRNRLAAMGKVLADPTRMAIVSYAFPARVAEIHVAIGDRIRQGQALVTLMSEEVGTAKADYYEAEAALELARVTHEREARLHDRGVGAKKTLLTTEAELKVAEARLEAAEKKLHLLGFSEEQVRTIADSHQINPVITLYAPIAGKAVEINAVRGAMIDQGTEILLLLDPSWVIVDAEIYERDIAAVHTEQAVEFTVPAFPGETFHGRISYIGDVLSEATRTITVRTAVENADSRLKPGMFANVRIVVNHETAAVVVPTSAVLHDDGQRIVFVRRGDGSDSYEARAVTVGSEDEGLVEIVAGIAAGDEVVTRGAYQLKSKLHEGVLAGSHTH